MQINETYRALDKSIDEHMKNINQGSFVTGWIMVVATSSPSDDELNTDSYMSLTSEGMPHHTQIGLLKVAQDERNAVGLMSTMSSILGRFIDDEDDD